MVAARSIFLLPILHTIIRSIKSVKDHCTNVILAKQGIGKREEGTRGDR
jgi:hypothetical protein